MGLCFKQIQKINAYIYMYNNLFYNIDIELKKEKPEIFLLLEKREGS